MSEEPDQDQALRAKLRKLFSKAKLPSSPALAARILELIEDRNSSAGDFGQVIGSDPALSGQLLKLANSAFFAQRTTVTTLERAVTVLGLRRVQTVSLGFQLVSHLGQIGDVPFDLSRFWQHSLLRACIARAVAQKAVPERAEEAFLVGLLQDCGEILLVQVLGSEYGELCCATNLSPTAFYRVERASFPYTHVEAISAMATEWRLPELISAPLAGHHKQVKLGSRATDSVRLSAVSYFAGALRFGKDMTVDRSELGLREYGRSALGLDDKAWRAAQKLAAGDYRRMAILYADNLPDNTDVVGLLGEANRQLVAVACEAEQRLVDVEAEREKLLNQQEQLAASLTGYRERAARDPLTGLLNRGALLEATRRAIDQSRDRGTPIGALFIDIDNFKSVNDRYGHDAGDEVLKAIASTICNNAGHGAAVGRYGGEEFVAVLSDLSADEVRQLSEQIVRRVCDINFTGLGVVGPVTCSVGAVGAMGKRVASAEELIAAADQRMYRAKRNGKNRSCFEALNNVDSSADSTDRLTSDLGNILAPAEKPPSDKPVAESFDRLRSVAKQLNTKGLAVAADHRKEQRQDFVAPCVVHFFTGVATRMQSELCCLRNIVPGGAGLVVTRPMVRGEPVELELDNAGSKLFLAGLVAFCRHIESNIHEVGIQFVTRSLVPIMFGDAEAAVRKLDWVTRALNVTGKYPPTPQDPPAQPHPPA